MAFGRSFEEFEVGDVYSHWPGKTVTEYDHHLFCLLTMARHPLHIDASTLLPISVSMGVAGFPKHGKSLSEVTQRADQALYRSKQEGRSRDRVWAA